MTNQPASRFPTFRRLAAATPHAARAVLRFFRKLPGRSWRLFRRVFLSRKSFAVYAVLGTAIALFYAGCGWYYGRAWEKEKERIIASGSSLDISRLLPPMPRDEDNFFATPVLKELFSTPENTPTRLAIWYPLDRKQTITVTGRNGKPYEKPIPNVKGTSLAAHCEWLRVYGGLPHQPDSPPGPRDLLDDHRFDDIFQELSLAAERPESRVPQFYEAPDSFSRIFKIKPMMRLVRSLILKGRAQAATGDPDAAADTMRVLQKISDGYAGSGKLMGVIIANNYSWGEAVLQEGMRDHQWTERSLTELLSLDGRPLLHQAWAKASETERAFGCGILESDPTVIYGQVNGAMGRLQPWLLRAWPNGLWRRHCIRLSRYHEAWGKETGALRSGESWASRAEKIRAIPEPDPLFLSFYENMPYNYIASFVGPSLVRAELLRTAIAVERHWLKHRRYPGTLMELDPAPQEGIPLGMDGQALHYRTNAEGTVFRIWSPRWPRFHSGFSEKDILLFANE